MKKYLTEIAVFGIIILIILGAIAHFNFICSLDIPTWAKILLLGK